MPYNLAPPRDRLNPHAEQLRSEIQRELGDKIGDLWEMNVDDAERILFGLRHAQATVILAEAEAFQCRARVEALFEVAPELVADALPANFFQRLACLESDLRARRNRGPRNPERDDIIRLVFRELRGETNNFPPRSYENALEALAKDQCLTAKAIERIVLGDTHLDYDAPEKIWIGLTNTCATTSLEKRPRTYR